MTEPATYSPAERVAAASAIALTGGLVLAKASSNSLDRALIVWLVLALMAGVVLGAGSVQGPVKTMFKRSLIPALLIPASYLGYMLVRGTIDWAKHGAVSMFRIPVSGEEAGGLSFATFAIYVLVLSSVTFLASLLLIGLAATSSRLIFFALGVAEKFGPEGVARISKLVAAIGGLIAAIFVVWAAFSENNPPT